MPTNINQASQTSSRTGIVTSAGTLFVANENRKGLIIQNLDTDVLFVKFGADASVTDFDFILNGGTVSDDGLGGMYESRVLVYTGIVTVTGTTPRFTGTEL